MDKKFPDEVIQLANQKPLEKLEGASEWEIINSLKSQYYDLSVEQTFDEETNKACLFQQDEWDYSAAHKDWLKTKFTTIFGENHSAPTLELLARIVGYHLSKGHSKKEYAPKTISGTLTDGKNFFEWLIDNNILVGTEGNYLIPASRLTTANISDFLDTIGSFALTTFLGKVRFISVWHELSKANRLPSFMSLMADPFKGGSLKKLWEARSEMREKRTEEDGAVDAIPLPYAFRMVDEALKLVIDRRAEVLEVYKLCQMAAEIDSDRHTGFKKLLHDQPELKEKLPVACFEKGELSVIPISDLIQSAQDSAIIIILATTGLRNWEMRDLKVGCCTPDCVIPNTYRLEACIKKTSRECGTGKLVDLPIPATTASAIELLELLRFHNSPYLVEASQGPSKSRAKRANTHYIDSRVRLYCIKMEVGYIPHPHQFRKTIAGWFGIHSKFATLLIMRLFSHESAAMANRYLFNNPLIKEERLNIILGAFKSIIGPLKEAILDDKVAGPMGERIKQTLDEHPRFAGLTGDELVQSLEQLLLERIASGETYLLLTPFAVCTTNTNSHDIPPCAANTCGDDKCSLESQVMRFNEHIPNPEKCQGAGCKRAIITPLSKGRITDELAFYKSVISDTEAEFAENILLMKKATNFVKNHEILVKDL